MGGGEVAEGRRRPTKAETVSGFLYDANLACQKSFSLTVLPIIIRSDVDDTYVSLFVLITIALPRGPWLTPSNHTRLTSFARSVL